MWRKCFFLIFLFSCFKWICNTCIHVSFLSFSPFNYVTKKKCEKGSIGRNVTFSFPNSVMQLSVEMIQTWWKFPMKNSSFTLAQSNNGIRYIWGLTLSMKNRWGRIQASCVSRQWRIRNACGSYHEEAAYDRLLISMFPHYPLGEDGIVFTGERREDFCPSKIACEKRYSTSLSAWFVKCPSF